MFIAFKAMAIHILEKYWEFTKDSIISRRVANGSDPSIRP